MSSLSDISCLPAQVCAEEFDASEKTIRRALELLEREGLIESVQRKRATVAFDYTTAHHSAIQTLKKVDTVAASDILKSGVLLCYPITIRGVHLCRGAEWETPEKILTQMNPGEPVMFWRLSNQFWRFFVARNGNDLILRTVDSLGFKDIDPWQGTYEMRSDYAAGLKQLIRAVKAGEKPEKTPLITEHYLSECRGTGPGYFSDSPLRKGSKALESQLFQTKERYSSVYLDLLGLIGNRSLPPWEPAAFLQGTADNL